MNHQLDVAEKIDLLDTGSRMYDGKLYTVKGGKTYVSEDWGDSFSSVDNNLAAAPYYNVHFTRSGVMIASKTREVFRAEYPYTDFTNVVNLTTTGSRINRWGFTEDDDGVLYMVEYGNYVDVETGGYLNIMYWYKSVNDGISWTKHDNLKNRDTKHFHQIMFSPFDKNLYITTGDANKLVFKSVDKGDTWEEIIPTTYPSQDERNIEYGGHTGIGFFETGEILWGTDWQPRDPETGNYWNWYVRSQGDDVDSFTYKKMPKKYYGLAGDIITDQVSGEAWMSLTDEFREPDVHPVLMYTSDKGKNWDALVEIPTNSDLNARGLIAYQDNSIKDSPYIFWDVIGEGIVRVSRDLKPKEGEPTTTEKIDSAMFYINSNNKIYEVELFNRDGSIKYNNLFVGN